MLMTRHVSWYALQVYVLVHHSVWHTVAGQAGKAVYDWTTHLRHDGASASTSLACVASLYLQTSLLGARLTVPTPGTTGAALAPLPPTGRAASAGRESNMAGKAQLGRRGKASN